MKKLSLLVLTLCLTTLSISGLAFADMQPSPGELVVVNNMQLQVDGSCEGSYTMSYGPLPVQDIRTFSVIVNPDCSFGVGKTVRPESPWYYTTSSACFTSEIQAVDPMLNYRPVTITQTDCFDFPVLGAACPPIVGPLVGIQH